MTIFILACIAVVVAAFLGSATAFVAKSSKHKHLRKERFAAMKLQLEELERAKDYASLFSIDSSIRTDITFDEVIKMGHSIDVHFGTDKVREMIRVAHSEGSVILVPHFCDIIVERHNITKFIYATSLIVRPIVRVWTQLMRGGSGDEEGAINFL